MWQRPLKSLIKIIEKIDLPTLSTELIRPAKYYAGIKTIIIYKIYVKLRVTSSAQCTLLTTPLSTTHQLDMPQDDFMIIIIHSFQNKHLQNLTYVFYNSRMDTIGGIIL